MSDLEQVAVVNELGLNNGFTLLTFKKENNVFIVCSSQNAQPALRFSCTQFFTFCREG